MNATRENSHQHKIIMKKTAMMISSRGLLLGLGCLMLVAFAVDGFATRRSTMTMKRGRGSFQKETGGGGMQQNIKSMGGGDSSSSSPKQWIPVSGLGSVKDLPTEEGKITLVDTMAKYLKNAATNPTGAVAVVKYGPNTYCMSSSCAACKIPLTKAKVLEANEETGNDPRLVCDFCKATYNLRTGERVKSDGGGGLLGGIVKGILSTQQTAPLPVYELGEAKGKVVINLG